jgi:hypothetical protein
MLFSLLVPFLHHIPIGFVIGPSVVVKGRSNGDGTTVASGLDAEVEAGITVATSTLASDTGITADTRTGTRTGVAKAITLA